MPTRLKRQNDRQRNRNISHRRQTAEVQRDNDRDESPEQKNELALRHQISFAGLIDQFGHFAHRAMNRQVLQLHIDRQAEQQAADAEQQPDVRRACPFMPKRNSRSTNPATSGWLRLRPRVPAARERMWEAADPGGPPRSCTGASKMVALSLSAGDLLHRVPIRTDTPRKRTRTMSENMLTPRKKYPIPYSHISSQPEF